MSTVAFYNLDIEKMTQAAENLGIKYERRYEGKEYEVVEMRFFRTLLVLRDGNGALHSTLCLGYRNMRNIYDAISSGDYEAALVQLAAACHV